MYTFDYFEVTMKNLSINTDIFSIILAVFLFELPEISNFTSSTFPKNLVRYMSWVFFKLVLWKIGANRLGSFWEGLVECK